MAGQRQSSLIDVDAQEFYAFMDALPERVKVRSRAELERLAIRIANAAKRYCPVLSGRLKSSIAFEGPYDGAGGTIYVDVGTHVNYAVFVEYGTFRMAAQPFLRPAVAEVLGYTGPTIVGRVAGARNRHGGPLRNIAASRVQHLARNPRAALAP